MRLALHIAAKDLREQRLLAAAWAVALATDLVLSTGWAHSFVATWPVAYDLKRLAVSLLASLLGAFVAVGAIHSDPAVSTTAFWLSRPIGRGSLLLAKLLVIALAIVLPAAEQWVAVAMTGGGATLAWRSLVEALFFQSLMILPPAALAAITPDAGRYVLLLVATLVALPFVQAVVSYARAGTLFPWRPVQAMFTGAVLLGALSLLVLGHQVLTRRTRRSAAIAALSLLLVVAAANSFTPAGRRARRPARVDPGSSLPVDTRPEIQARVGAGGMGRASGGAERAGLLVDFEVTGLPPGTAAAPIAVRASWSFDGGPRLESRAIGYASGWWYETVPNQPLFREAVGRLLGSELLGESSFAQRALHAGIGFDRAALAANRDRAATLTLDVELLLVRLRAAGTVPLRPGQAMWAGANHLVVLEERPGRPVEVRVDHLRPSLFLRGAMWHDAADGLALVVTSRSGQAAVALGGIAGGSFGGGLSHVRHRTMSMGYRAEVDREWLSGAELTPVTLEPRELIRRVVEVEGLRFEDLPVVDGRGL